MNLRLRPDAEAALKDESRRTGVSQQEILRRAVDEHLGLVARAAATRLPDWVVPAAEPPRAVHPQLRLPDGVNVIDLIDRADRV